MDSEELIIDQDAVDVVNAAKPTTEEFVPLEQLSCVVLKAQFLHEYTQYLPWLDA